jgi:hypothetical protein
MLSVGPVGLGVLAAALEGPRVFRTRNPLRFFLGREVVDVETAPVVYS